MKILLDTCTILWSISLPDQLSQKAKNILTDEISEIFVSPMSCAEVACAVDRKKLVLDQHWKLWFRKYVDINNWQIISVDLPIIEEAYSLPGDFHRDPVDRILVATSRLHQAQLLTADKKILNYPHVSSEW
ncbi:MAG: hypothetical protein A3F16_01725 [Deltaproteobacteria bacterium RIFCSPHIGHO2_12_FULL_43_9]|nr:MAG: hypothetical protein A3F16_01725 [Deltaproteobacteria bacterium RIFCSPHIGHO2_12_FULL_43_9]